ncbi:MAG: MATE family efflux transporter [Gemmatimonadaceae bacterium]|nr:MATE family efflux transporter [Gemmatimonadaceae bacterium]
MTTPPAAPSPAPASRDATHGARAADGPAHPGRAEFRALGRLALPVVAVELGLMAMGAVDTMMVGHLSATALAATALAAVYFYTVMVIAMGTLVGCESLLSQAVGAHDEPGFGRALQRGFVLAALLLVPCALLLVPTAPMLRLLGQPEVIIAPASRFVHISIAGLAPLLGFVVLRMALQARERLAPILVAIVVANAVNLALNWVLVFGHLGAPRLGTDGSALASVAARWTLLAVLLVAAWRDLRPYLRTRASGVADPRALGRMLVLGVPVGVQYLLEVGVFNVVALFMGTMATATLAAHQVAINLASITFMVPLGIGAATSVLVGQAIGRADAAGARRAAHAGLALGAAVMLVSAVAFLTVPRLLAALYVREPAVIALAATFIPLAGIFQLFDGLQAVAGGALRGAADTRAAMWANILGFWAIGLPLGLALAFRAGMGPAGLWWGLVIGLASVAFVLVLRVRRRFRAPLARAIVDAPPAIPA